MHLNIIILKVTNVLLRFGLFVKVARIELNVFKTFKISNDCMTELCEV